MKVSLLFFSFTYLIGGFVNYHTTRNTVQSKKILPVMIMFKKPIPPDSIQDFMKVYLQTRGVEVITQDQYFQAFNESLSAKTNEAINNGIFNAEKAKEFAFLPISKSLFLKIHSHSGIKNDSYIVDSVYWDVKLLPPKDTAMSWKLFVASESKNNPFITLKALSDQILSSGILK